MDIEPRPGEPKPIMEINAALAARETGACAELSCAAGIGEGWYGLVCPHCGRRGDDAADYISRLDIDDVSGALRVFTCPQCGREYVVRDHRAAGLWAHALMSPADARYLSWYRAHGGVLSYREMAR
jgi:predicted RNA-binding Zn-ribbon protein involved in translation (DUF1610 family)